MLVWGPIEQDNLCCGWEALVPVQKERLPALLLHILSSISFN